MKGYIEDPYGREKICSLLERLGDYAAEIDELYTDLSDYMDDYMDDAEEKLNKASFYLEKTFREHKLNHMLWRELNAGRKELLSLLDELSENGIQPPAGKYLDHRRLDPDLYPQAPDCPFYDGDPDAHYTSLLEGQFSSLVLFEEQTPMTTLEREALLEHILLETDLDADPWKGWIQFLDELRASR